MTLSRSRREGTKSDHGAHAIDETLIRTWLSKCWPRLGDQHGPASARGQRPAERQGRFGLFTDVDEAVAAAREAFERLSAHDSTTARRIIGHIRRISIEQCVELGTMEMEETKIGRLAAQDREAQDPGRAARWASSSSAARSSAAITAWR